MALACLSIFGCVAAPDSGSGADLLFAAGGFEDDAADVVSGAARIWSASASLYPCTHWDIVEDFSSGRYNVHRYRTTLPSGGPVTIRLDVLAGSWAPVVLVADGDGLGIYEGEAVGDHVRVEATPVHSGRAGSAAEVVLSAAAATEASVYVTSWEALASGFEGSLPRDARYSLDLRHGCADAGSSAWEGVYGGLTQEGVPIPREGLWSETLELIYDDGTERYGAVVSYDGVPFVSGRVSWFGGPNDRGVSSSETGSISGDVLRELNVPLDPSPTQLASRPEDFYFLAMRFDYGPAGISFWREARLLLVNPANGSAVVVRPVDWGPGRSTGRTADVSPQIMDELDLTTDDDVFVAFASPFTPLGRIR